MTNKVREKLQEIERLNRAISRDSGNFLNEIVKKYGNIDAIDGINSAIIESSADNIITSLKIVCRSSSELQNSVNVTDNSNKTLNNSLAYSQS